MFSDLKKGFQVHTLDTNTVPKYELGKVVAVSEPRYLPPQPGQYQAMQTRVVDLTVELTGETKTYTVPHSRFSRLEKKGIKILYRSAGNRIPVAGLFHITFFGYEYSTRI